MILGNVDPLYFNFLGFACTNISMIFSVESSDSLVGCKAISARSLSLLSVIVHLVLWSILFRRLKFLSPSFDFIGKVSTSCTSFPWFLYTRSQDLIKASQIFNLQHFLILKLFKVYSNVLIVFGLVEFLFLFSYIVILSNETRFQNKVNYQTL